MVKETVVALLILTLIVVWVSYFVVAFEYHIQETKKLMEYRKEIEREKERERMREKEFWKNLLS